jgi:hypothetical protein
LDHNDLSGKKNNNYGHLQDTREIEETLLLPHGSTGQEMGDGLQIHSSFHTPVKVVE